ncbi:MULTISPECIES: alpha/beta fold hydrolase [unclassified Streptomyces]|uniref:alpha/beta fold hydrolase n=1 Tax=unclassified Streptomyces TaxID=2593676 RepID=UPI0023663F91|nr:MULTISPECIES: alpha/beta fold hydrolase [unclassified Streptomyces]MDF3141560.1 alpha/beta fold hydrolase [Streptomyces sp. T21Q-yed]WDF39002.1 alpha/beta fold hydrolase [Streptomyces sp. T12]
MESIVKVDGGEVWADDTGGGDTGGDGVPVVLLHPGVADSRLWDRVAPALAARHRVIRYDSRGFGRSPRPTTAYSLVADLRAVLDHFGVERAVLVGSSMGGATAIGLALDEPPRVAALALLVPGVTGYPELESPELTTRLGELASAGDMDGLVALSLQAWGAAGTPPDTEAVDLLRAAIPAWPAMHRHRTEDPPAFPRLGELSVPCTLLLGERDLPRVVRCNEAMAAAIPGCRLVRLAACDHFPTLRAPQTVVSVVAELCAGITEAV